MLNEAEQERYRDVEIAPSIVEHELTPASVGFDVPAPRARKRRLVLWPVAAALAIGIGAGFLGGYGVGSRDRIEVPVFDVSPPVASSQSAPAPVPAAPAAPAAGREFTESAVTDASKPPPAAAAPAPPQRAASAATAAGSRPTETPKGTAIGRVLVRSTPAGARVFVDGRDYGQTPAAVRDLAVGAHQVRITRDGYVAEERRVAITAARPAQSITVPLSRTRTASAAETSAPLPSTPATVGRFVGGLAIDSRPPGAKVYIDGKLVGNTPLALGDVRAGEHVVRIEQEGYRRWSSSVRVVAAEQNRVTASLER